MSLNIKNEETHRRARKLPLLFKGNDFSQTDIVAAL